MIQICEIPTYTSWKPRVNGNFLKGRLTCIHKTITVMGMKKKKTFQLIADITATTPRSWMVTVTKELKKY